MAPTTSHASLPPFPSDIKTAPLVSISLSKLLANDAAESAAFYESCKSLGFFYMDCLGCDLGESIVAEAEEIHALQKEFFKLPNAVKDTFGIKNLDPFYAYRYTELDIVGDDGEKLRNANYNIRKDDLIGQAPPLRRHKLIADATPLLRSYALHCRAAIDTMLAHLNTHLELPANTLQNLHRGDHRSGDHIRFTQAPPQPWNDVLAERAAHTDFGSLTILFNWLGGLQIRTPDTGEWVYVKPVPGSCIVNLGDAMVTFSAGILRSNIHRVVPPPPPQDGLTRNSLVFFTRPESDVVLRRLEGGLVDAQPATADPGMTSEEWILKRGSGELPGVFTKTGFEKQLHPMTVA